MKFYLKCMVPAYHDITEILLKVAINTINQAKPYILVVHILIHKYYVIILRWYHTLQVKFHFLQIILAVCLNTNNARYTHVYS
jgi:hypothetical protein